MVKDRIESVKIKEMNWETGKLEQLCSVCETTIKDHGHNPDPIPTITGEVCNDCNTELIIPIRISLFLEKDYDYIHSKMFAEGVI
jgi:hypothetical protein